MLLNCTESTSEVQDNHSVNQGSKTGILQSSLSHVKVINNANVLALKHLPAIIRAENLGIVFTIDMEIEIEISLKVFIENLNMALFFIAILLLRETEKLKFC